MRQVDAMMKAMQKRRSNELEFEAKLHGAQLKKPASESPENKVDAQMQDKMFKHLQKRIAQRSMNGRNTRPNNRRQ